MKPIFPLLTAFAVTFTACRREQSQNFNIPATQAGYLLTTIITEGDTSFQAEYNSRNQLVKLDMPGAEVHDMIYDASDRLIAYKVSTLR